MSTVQKVRYALAAAAAVTAVGLMIGGQVLVGVFCLIGAVLLLPILYQRLLIHSNEVQLVSPMLFLAITVFSFMMMQAIPRPYDVPLKSVYSDAAVQTTSTTAAAVTTTSGTATLFATTSRQTPVYTTAISFETSADTMSPTTTKTIVVTQTTALTQVVIPTEVTFTTTEQQPTVTTVQDAPLVGNTVYRTPSGKRYHLNASCGGKNAYEVTYEDAVEAGLTPCKKCAGG